MKYLVIFILTVILVFSLAKPALALFYPFGGVITKVFPGGPASPCPPAPAMIVTGVKGGVFILPPKILFAFFNLAPTKLALGLATKPACGVILMVGTSL